MIAIVLILVTMIVITGSEIQVLKARIDELEKLVRQQPNQWDTPYLSQSDQMDD
jgi:hypothetical protein